MEIEIEIEELYNKYNSKYEELKLEIEHSNSFLTNKWGKGKSVNFFVFEIEKIGNSKGVFLKKEPVKKDNVFLYKYKDNLLMYSTSYISNYINSESFYVKDNNKVIRITYYSKEGVGFDLESISIVVNEGNKQKQNIYYSKERRKITFLNANIEHEDNLIKIKEKGYINRKVGEIKLDRDYEIIYINDDEFEIYCTTNNLENKIVEKNKIFPC